MLFTRNQARENVKNKHIVVVVVVIVVTEEWAGLVAALFQQALNERAEVVGGKRFPHLIQRVWPCLRLRVETNETMTRLG